MKMQIMFLKIFAFHTFENANEEDEVGIVRGLAWTSVGGDTLQIEVNVICTDFRFFSKNSLAAFRQISPIRRSKFLTPASLV